MDTERRWMRRSDGTYWIASTDDMVANMIKNGFVPATEAEALAAEGPATPPAQPAATATTDSAGSKAK